MGQVERAIGPSVPCEAQLHEAAVALRKGEGNRAFETCYSSHQDADLQSIKDRQLPIFLTSTGQTHRFPDQVKFRRKEFKVSRLSEMTSPTSLFADKETGPDTRNQQCWKLKPLLLLGGGTDQEGEGGSPVGR